MIRSFFTFTSTFTLVVLMTCGYQASAQCCSPGNPVAGTSFVGILDPMSVRSITFYRHNYSDTYYEGSKVASLQGKTANFNYIGQMIGFGLAKRVGMELELGYFINKTEEDQWVGLQSTQGWSNGALLAKGLIFRVPMKWEITGAAGWKFPLGTKVFYDEYGLPLPATLQPSTRAHGAIAQLYVFRMFNNLGARAILINRYETNGLNEEEYRFGDALFSSLFLSKTFFLRYSAILQIRNEYRRYDYQSNTKFAVTGGDVVFISPQFAYSFPPSWVITVGADLPAYRYYNGLQLGSKAAFSISVVKDLHFK